MEYSPYHPNRRDVNAQQEPSKAITRMDINAGSRLQLRISKRGFPSDNMKVVLVALALTLALCRATQCPRHSDKYKKNIACSRVMKQLVKLDPDNGTMTPSVVMVPRCDSFQCKKSGHTCEPTKKRIENYKVEINGPEGSSQECRIIPVEVHSKCACACTLVCHTPKVINKETCSCKCDRIQEKECNDREGNMYMWNEDLCSCRCNIERNCSQGHIWDMESCRCVPQSAASDYFTKF